MKKKLSETRPLDRLDHISKPASLMFSLSTIYRSRSQFHSPPSIYLPSPFVSVGMIFISMDYSGPLSLSLSNYHSSHHLHLASVNGLVLDFFHLLSYLVFSTFFFPFFFSFTSSIHLYLRSLNHIIVTDFFRCF